MIPRFETRSYAFSDGFEKRSVEILAALEVGAGVRGGNGQALGPAPPLHERHGLRTRGVALDDPRESGLEDRQETEVAVAPGKVDLTEEGGGHLHMVLQAPLTHIKHTHLYMLLMLRQQEATDTLPLTACTGPDRISKPN